MFLDHHWLADAVNGGSKFDDREPEFIELLNQARALRAEYLEGCISLPRKFNTVANYVGKKLRGYPVDGEGVYYIQFVSNLLAEREAQMLNDPSTRKEPAYYEFKIDKGDVFTYFKLCITPTGVVTVIEQVTYSDAALYPDAKTFIVRDLSGTD